MKPPSDYSQSSLSELYDVQRHIDKGKYPDTYTALLQEIEKREKQQTEPSQDKGSLLQSPFLVLPLACLGLYWGGWALFMIYAHLIPTAPARRNDLEPWFGVFLGAVWLLVALLCLVPAISYFTRNRD